jgi:hypothetical protein
MGKLWLGAAAALAALAIPAGSPAEANHRDGWGVRANVVFVSHDRGWRDGRRHWRGDRWRWRDDWRWRDHRRWRGHRGWRGHPWGWRQTCRRWWWDGWGWRCRW